MIKQAVLFFGLILGTTILVNQCFSDAASSGLPRVIILTSKNTVVLNMPVTGGVAADLQQDLMEASSRLRARDPIYLVLNSPGGSIPDGEKIIETVKGLPNPVNTVTIFSASMSFVLSQYMNDRLILNSGVMMSHRAYAGGLEGQVPGNLITRTLGLLDSITQMDAVVANRANTSLKDYQASIKDELWLRGEQAVQKHFADEVVRVNCDSSLKGVSKPKKINLMGLFTVNVSFYRCPLITQPAGVSFDNASESDKKEALELLYNPKGYVKQHGVSRLIGENR